MTSRVKRNGSTTSRASVPLVVGLPVYNGEQYLASAISSLLNQTFGDFVLLVRDNASTDGTEEICRSFARDDRRLRYERLPENVGAIANFNDVATQGRSELHAPLFKWAAHDDTCAPTFLERCVDALRDDPSAVLAYPGTVLIDEHDNGLTGWSGDSGSQPRTWLEIDTADRASSPSPSDRFRDVLLNEVWCFPVFGVIRSAALERTPPQTIGLSPDKILLANLSLLGRFAYVEEPLFFRRLHSQQYTAMSAKDRARWAGADHANLEPLHLIRSYLDAARRTPLSARERTRAYAAIARLTFGRDKLMKVLRPGPYNYLGWHGSRPAGPFEHLPLATATIPDLGAEAHDEPTGAGLEETVA